MKVRRWLCKDCAPAKLIGAGLRYGRSPSGDREDKCAFCGRLRFCKCYYIEIGGQSAL